MQYNPSTDSYQNDFLEKILDTDIKCNIPYKIDRKKYQEILERNKKKMRIVDADVVSFTYDLSQDDEGKIWLCAFYAWPENSPEGSEDFYDCFLFDKIDYGEDRFVAHNKFVKELFECIIGVDVEHTIKLRENKVKEIEENFKELDTIDNIIFFAKQ